MAALILGVTVAGAYSAWSASFMSIYRTNEAAICADLARSDLEKAKAAGFWNLPTGTLSGSTGTYSGTTSNPALIAEWYSISGSFISYQTSGGAPPAGAAYELVRITTDSGVTTGAGTTYYVNGSSTRVVCTSVIRLSDGSTVDTMGTELVNGGL